MKNILKSIPVQFTACALISVCSTSSAYSATMTEFNIVDSSPTSWVARGYQDYTVSPELGWTFTPSENFDNGVSFNITGPELPNTDVDQWRLDFAAPFEERLTPGVYNDFQRFPFQDSNRPGMGFSSTGRGDNRASGSFEVLEISYDDLGELLSFAADFTHYGTENPNNFAMGEIRFNSEADNVTITDPGGTTVPESSSIVGIIAALGMGALVKSKMNSRLTM